MEMLIYDIINNQNKLRHLQNFFFSSYFSISYYFLK